MERGKVAIGWSLAGSDRLEADRQGNLGLLVVVGGESVRLVAFGEIGQHECGARVSSEESR